MAEIKFEIKDTTGMLSESAKGLAKELNLVSWNYKEQNRILTYKLKYIHSGRTSSWKNTSQTQGRL